ncbi:MAG: efflux RND transporter periplasmic adaptor subunit [Thermodesulfobacteriota bacterium]
MKKTNIILLALAVVIAAAGAWYFFYSPVKKPAGDFTFEDVRPKVGPIAVTISTTGAIKPKNRLEIKPAINGRIEEVLVREGTPVRQGQVVARMSSTERAALLDAARGQGESMEYWKNVYKATPLTSPISGEVIVRSVEPGQTVTTQDAVIVLSDRLIVGAQVDETDIGLVRPGQKAAISPDAYPESAVGGVVDHIAYESTVVNNVTVYEVDILPDAIPDFFRSGMSVNVDITVNDKPDALLVPIEALIETNGKKHLLVRRTAAAEPVQTEVTIGLANTEQVEITGGITPDTVVVIRRQKYALPEGQTGSNPFSPFGRRSSASQNQKTPQGAGQGGR